MCPAIYSPSLTPMGTLPSSWALYWATMPLTAGQGWSARLGMRRNSGGRHGEGRSVCVDVVGGPAGRQAGGQVGKARQQGAERGDASNTVRHYSNTKRGFGQPPHASPKKPWDSPSGYGALARRVLGQWKPHAPPFPSSACQLTSACLIKPPCGLRDGPAEPPVPERLHRRQHEQRADAPRVRPCRANAGNIVDRGRRGG